MEGVGQGVVGQGRQAGIGEAGQGRQRRVVVGTSPNNVPCEAKPAAR